MANPRNTPAKSAPATLAATAHSALAGGWPADRYSDVAGRFVRDKATGERLPADQATAAAMVAAGIDKELQVAGIRPAAAADSTPLADSQ